MKEACILPEIVVESVCGSGRVPLGACGIHQCDAWSIFIRPHVSIIIILASGGAGQFFSQEILRFPSGFAMFENCDRLVSGHMH